MESEKEIHQCPTCQKILSTKNSLKRHLNTVHKKQKLVSSLNGNNIQLDKNQQTLDSWLIKTPRSSAAIRKLSKKPVNKKKKAKTTLFSNVSTQTYASPMNNKDIDTGKFRL